MSVAPKPQGTGPRIGIDLGGTKTEIMVLSAEGNTLLRHRVATPSHSYQAIVATIVMLVQQALEHTGPIPHIGIGIPGASDQRSGLIKNANTTCLIGQPLQRDLEQALQCPVKLENDANCFTLSEATDGSGAGYGLVFGVILGTGVGAGWCHHGHLHAGMHHIAGEWGHNPIPLRLRLPLASDLEPNAHPTLTRAHTAPFLGLGRPCYCGQVDCIETHLCGHGLATTHALLRHARATNPASPTEPQPTLWTAQQIAQAAAQADPAAREALELYARQLACALSTIINGIDPDIIVLGGGLSNLDAIYPLVQAALPEFVFNNRVMTPVVKARHGDSSGVRGAAWL